MAYTSDQTYYSSTANYGTYQYMSLSDMVNSFMFSRVGEDKAIHNVDRNLVRFHMKQCIKELNYDAVKNVKVLELLIGDDLKAIMPPDYVDYVRMSLFANGVLRPLTENRSAISSKQYDLDSNNDLQFDGNGNVLYETTSDLDQSRLDGNLSSVTVDDFECTTYTVGAKFSMDTANANGNPKFRVNQKAGVIDFDSSMSGQQLVIEYISDGMEAGDDSLIGVHKFFEQYVYNYVSLEILEHKDATPVMKVDSARKRKSSSLRQARLRISKVNSEIILMMLRGQNKWIK